MQQRPVGCCPFPPLRDLFLRTAALAAWCPEGTVGDAAPHVARPAVPLSHAPAQQPPTGSARQWFVAPRTLMVVVWRAHRKRWLGCGENQICGFGHPGA